jgi:uncharacterized membrane protein YphA (DoxX/SURF4 family)
MIERFVTDGTLRSLLLSGVRVVLGIFWLLQLTWKPPPGFGCPEGFCKWVNNEVQYPAIPLYGELVRHLVQPNVYLFGWLTTVVEVAIGLSLLLGLLTRLGGLAGTLWSLNLTIGLLGVPGEQGWYYAFLLMLNAVYLAVGSDGQLALDRLIGWRDWWNRPVPTSPRAAG